MGEGAGEPRRWLTIDAACRLLGVDHSTLRRWSDAGRIDVFVTPGGHRRYAEADVRALIEQARGGRHPLSGPLLTGMSLSHYGPERLSWVQAQSWYALFDAATLGELREEGRQLVELAMRYVSSREGYAAREEIMDEAVALAGRYGERNARLGIGLGDSVTAFLFFRAPTVETVASYMETEYLPPKRAARVFRDLGEFLDRLLLAMIGAHERELAQRRARPTRRPARFTGQL